MDAVTAEVVTALSEAGVRAIVLKGPSLASWLYEDGIRHYLDSDLLVDPGHVSAAEAVLESLRFEHLPLDDIPHDRPWHAHAWVRRGTGTGVDLHRTLIGAGVAPAEVWRILSDETEPMRVGGLEVEVLNLPARGLHVALHAAADGVRTIKPLTDLAKALERAPEDVWRGASALAARLEATQAFAAGLRLLPAGEALAARLGLPEQRSVEIALRADAAPPLSLGFEWLSSTPGLWRKLRFLGRKLVPPPAFMRAWSPLAEKRGRLGLAVAYLWRPVWLLRHAAPAFRAWWRARRSSS